MLKVLLSLLLALVIASALLYVVVFWKKPPALTPSSDKPVYMSQDQCQKVTGKACGQNPRLEWEPSAIKLIK